MSQLVSIDMQVGMRYSGNNQKLYIKMVDRFYKSYKDIDLSSMSQDDFQRAIHNLKTISMSIGAIKLHEIAKDIDMDGDRDKLPVLDREIRLVLEDIESLLEDK